MVNKKSRLIIATMLAVISFLSIVYVSSCTKVGKDMTHCLHITCQNGGYCHQRTDTTAYIHPDTCVCPTGFEGVTCQTVAVTKYIGTWAMTQTIIGSDSMQYIVKKDTTYTAYLRTTPTPTTFFIANFNNNAYYNDIICTMDSLNSSHFTIDTISAFQMIYYNYQILSGSGIINKTKDTIVGNFITRHRNYTTNWEVDTLAISLILQNR